MRLTGHIALKIMDISEKKYLYLLVITIHVVGVTYLLTRLGNIFFFAATSIPEYQLL